MTGWWPLHPGDDAVGPACFMHGPFPVSCNRVSRNHPIQLVIEFGLPVGNPTPTDDGGKPTFGTVCGGMS